MTTDQHKQFYMEISGTLYRQAKYLENQIEGRGIYNKSADLVIKQHQLQNQIVRQERHIEKIKIINQEHALDIA